MSSRQRIAATIFGGALIFMSFPEWDLFPLAWIGLIPILAAVEGATPKRAFLLGWLAGFVTNQGGFYWIEHVLQQFGHMPPIVAWPLSSLLAVYQGLWFGIWAWFCRRFEDRVPVPRAITRIAAWGAVELSFPLIFPWYLANSQWNFPIATQICDLGGVMLLSCIVVSCSVLLYEAACLPAQRARLLGALALILAANFGYGMVRLTQVDAEIAAAPTVRIGLIEANIGLQHEADPDQLEDALALHQRMSKLAADAGAELIVWPESAYDASWFPVTAERVPPAGAPLPPEPAWDALKVPPSGHLVIDQMPMVADSRRDKATKLGRWDRAAPQRGFDVPLLFGAVTYEEDPDPPAEGRRWQRLIRNSALLLDGDGAIDGRIYHKNYLLVFGEYIPFGRKMPWLYDMVPEASAFTPGTEFEVFELGKLRAGPIICYEGIIPRWAQGLADKNPNVLINITNDAWFGKSGEPWLHLVLTMFRAIENRRTLVRSTNTGISAFVDPAGRLVKHTSVYKPEVLVHDVPLLEGGTMYRTIGDSFGWLCLVGCALIAIRSRRTA